MKTFRTRAEAEAAGFAIVSGSLPIRYEAGQYETARILTPIEAQLLEALEAVQWMGSGETGYALCPQCDKPPSRGHAVDCKLSAAIKAATGD